MSGVWDQVMTIHREEYISWPEDWDDIVPAEILDRSHIAEWYGIYHTPWMPKPQ